MSNHTEVGFHFLAFLRGGPFHDDGVWLMRASRLGETINFAAAGLYTFRGERDAAGHPLYFFWNDSDDWAEDDDDPIEEAGERTET